MSVQKELGYVATCKGEFKVQIPGDERLYESVYDFIDKELCRGQLIGHIVDMNGEPNLLITRIVEVNQLQLGQVCSVKTISVLHDGDTRRLDELAVSEWIIPRDRVACILDLV